MCPRSAILKILKVLLHIISRIEIGLQFVRHDDSLVHVAEIEGDYKVRLAFYWNMHDCQRAQLNIDLDGLPVWRKPKIVRTPLKVVTDKSKGNKRLRNKSRKRKSTTSSAKDQPHRKSTVSILMVRLHLPKILNKNIKVQNKEAYLIESS